MAKLFLILKIIFVLFYMGTLSYMANYFFKKSAWDNFNSLCGILAVFGIIFTGQAYLVKAYSHFTTQEVAKFVLVISRYLISLFFIIVNLFSYYMYIASFNKKRYQTQQNIIIMFSVLAFILVTLPQNDYSNPNPGLLLPRLRVIPSVIAGFYVSLILLADAYYKRNPQFQIYAICLVGLNLVQIVNSYFLKAKEDTEFYYYAMTSIIFIFMMAIFYRELYKKKELERF